MDAVSEAPDGSEVEMSDVSAAYGSRRILSDISLSVKPGEVVALVGPSGIGKSTLLNLLCGAVAPEQGIVRIFGLLPPTAARQQRIGYLFQSPTLLPWRTAFENVMLPLELRGLGHVEAAPKARAAMRQAKIEAAANLFPHRLSGGMQTRVAIARTLVYQPSLLLLDEPFSALDDAIKGQLYVELQEVLAELRPAIVMITHNLIEALILSDKIYVLGKTSEDKAASIRKALEVAEPRPRSFDIMSQPRVRETWSELLSLMAAPQLSESIR
jgi:NitT/TauT family transport system ATP-binding protein